MRELQKSCLQGSRYLSGCLRVLSFTLWPSLPQVYLVHSLLVIAVKLALALEMSDFCRYVRMALEMF